AEGSVGARGHQDSRVWRLVPDALTAFRRRAPSVLGPERFAVARREAYIFGEVAATRATTACFPELEPCAVLLPESFRGGCSFGAAFRISRTTVSPAQAQRG